MDTRKSINSIKNIIRSPYLWPGGYTKMMAMADGETLCADCVKENYRLILRATLDHDWSSWEAYATVVHWEGPPMCCAHCNKEMPSEYGDPDA